MNLAHKILSSVLQIAASMFLIAYIFTRDQEFANMSIMSGVMSLLGRGE